MYNQPNYFQPFTQMNSPQYPSQQVPRKSEIIHVNGENGAQAFQMLPNSQALLLDDTAPIIWLAQTDGAGYKTIVPYKISPYQPEPEITVKELDERLKKIEEVISNAKSNVASSKKQSGKQSQPD